MSRFNNSIIKSCKISSCQKIMSKNALIFDILDKFPRWNIFRNLLKKIDMRGILISQNLYNFIMKSLEKYTNHEIPRWNYFRKNIPVYIYYCFLIF